MAADTAAKRYSAMNLGSPWRGLNVVPDVTIPQGERQAVEFMYSGILAAVTSSSNRPLLKSNSLGKDLFRSLIN